MRRSVRYLTSTIALLSLSTFAHAEDRPHLNAYFDAKATASTSALKDKVERAAGYVASRDPQRGTPTFFWAPKYGVRPSQLAATTPESSARWYLDHYASVYGLSRDALKTVQVAHVHDTGTGGIIVTLRQVVDGVEVIRNEAKVLMNRKGELIAISGNLHSSATTGMKRGRAFKLSASQAVANAFNDLYGTSVPGAGIVDTKQTKAGYGYFDLADSTDSKVKELHFVEPARAKRVYFPMPKQLVSAYYVEFMSGKKSSNESDAYAYVIAADDGRILYRANLTESAAFKYRVWAETTGNNRPLDGPQANYTPHPTGTPDGSSPAFIAPELITVDGFNKNPNNTFDPWLTASATETVGNNVDAYVDHNAPDGLTTGDFRASTTTAQTFDRIFDTAVSPIANQTQEMAATTQLFFVNNWLHDWWYDSGFNEAAGNAQKSNFGRGGVEGDVLRAEAQDGALPPTSNRNNANMSAMSDGTSPRMQMYLWTGSDTHKLDVQPLNQAMASNTASFGPQNFDVTGGLELGVDGTAPVNDGCEALTNANLNGKVVLLDRGNCNFTQKVKNAQQKGAVGVVIANNAAGGVAPGMGGTDPSVTIPALSVSLEDGNILKMALMNGAQTAHLTRQVGVERDGTIDNGIVAHEWGHYLHHRLVQCGSKMCGAMSEGWADFVALHMTMAPNDDLNGTYALAIYATATLGDAGYFGIRRYPYSADMTKSPLTFKHVTDGVALPMGVPTQPAAPDNSEVHNAGEIWSAMVFEGYLALLGESKGANPRYTYDQARRLMSDYVAGGMKLAPVEPTFIEQRDGILAAALANEPKDFLVLAQAFAKRGFGTCAVSPDASSTDFSGVVEDFNTRPNMAIVEVKVDDSVKSCDTDGVLDADEIGKVAVKIRNTGAAPLVGATAQVSSTTMGVTFPKGATVTFPSVDPFAEAVGMVEIALDKAITQKIGFDLKVDATAPDGCTTSLSSSMTGNFNYDNVADSSTTDDVESSLVKWTTSDANSMPSQLWNRVTDMSANNLWHGDDVGGIHDESLVSPKVTVSATDPFILSFQHRYQFEADAQANWDGAVIEVSEDDGMTWNDISQYGNPGYGGSIGDPNAGNPLLGRQGYVAESQGYPMMQTQTINMGNSLAGKTVQVRFRIGSDEAAGAAGWDIDNISFQGITNKPFATVVDDATTCMLPPQVVAGMDQSVACGETVTLDASGSFDYENDPLTFKWTQKSGPSVTLSGADTAKATFAAPDVTTPTTLSFEVAVSDGQSSASAVVNVVVNGNDSCGNGGTGGNGTGGNGGAGGGDNPKGGEPGDDGGCGCSVVGDDTAGLKLAPLAALAAAVFMRRRRSRKGERRS